VRRIAPYRRIANVLAVRDVLAAEGMGLVDYPNSALKKMAI
jgi:hypothetical protein